VRSKSALAAACLAGVLLVLEGGLRLQAFFDELRVEKGWKTIAAAARPSRGAVVSLEDVVRPSPDPKRIYELLPDLDVTIVHRIVTNSAGFRGHEFAATKPPSTVRIVGLGDSVMFGLGLEESETFLARLGPLLSARFPSVAWEVVNLAVPGYDTVNEVATLEAKGLGYAPDLVILNFVADDLGLPKFIVRRSQPLALDRSFLVARLAGLLHGPEGGSGTGLIASVRRRDGVRGAVLTDDVRAMAGFDAFAEAIANLKRLSEKHSFHILVVGHPRLPREVHELVHGLGIASVASEPVVTRYMRRNGIDDIRDPRLAFSAADPHPTAIAHGLIAEAIATHLDEIGEAEALVNGATSEAGAPATAPPP